MKTVRHILALAATFAAFCGLAGCASAPKAVVPAAVLIQPDPALTAKDACPSWPRKADVILKGTEAEASTYDLKAYDAYRCERSTRLAIGVQVKKLADDAAKRK